LTASDIPSSDGEVIEIGVMAMAWASVLLL